MKNDSTLDFYNKNNTFSDGTLYVDFSDIQDKFLSYFPTGGLILDFGCGSGRETIYFLNKGMNVDAIDGPEAHCKIASKITGITVKHMLFQELSEKDKYDGIGVCTYIFHLSKDKFK